MTSNVTPLYPPDDVHELASQALFSLPADYKVADLGDDWLRVKDVHEALTTGGMDPVSVLDCLHFRIGGSLIRPDLMPAVAVVLNDDRHMCGCGHGYGFHRAGYGHCLACGSCSGFAGCTA